MTVRDYGVVERHRWLLSEDRLWLGLALAVAGLVYLTYLATHRYPAYGAGLYMTFAEQISANGYALPTMVPGYTDGGIPFGYPPLMFYVAAVIRDVAGVGPFTYSRALPGLLVMAYLVPYYYVARELLGTPPRAGVATLLFAITPEVLQWHLSAGGVVRSGAFLLALCGTYAGVRLFQRDDDRWLAPATALFGLTVLAHPMYAVFYAVTFLLLYARFDRSRRGLVRGAIVAGGGLAVAAPWWVQVLRTHGPEIFLAASGTHGGIGGGLAQVVSALLAVPPLGVNVFSYLLVGAGLAYGLRTRRYFLVAWVAVTWYVVDRPRFLFVAGTMLVALLALECLQVVARKRAAVRGSVAPSALAVGLAVAAVGTGVLFAGGMIDAHGDSASQPAYVDDHDIAAMRWATANTGPAAEFVVLGDAAEWFPQRTGRTILVGPWGAEWTSSATYDRQLSLFRQLSTCRTEQCLTATMAAGEVSPEYVYVPTDQHTVRGFEHDARGQLRDSLAASDRYELAFENDGVAVFRVERGEQDRPANPAVPASYDTRPAMAPRTDAMRTNHPTRT